jgi:hypothetical protein
MIFFRDVGKVLGPAQGTIYFQKELVSHFQSNIYVFMFYIDHVPPIYLNLI